jgi:predicted transcriptional regulator
MKFPPATDIRKIRISMDITQAQLAERSGVSQSTIAKIERGKISASYETVVTLFDTLEAMKNDIGQGLTAADVCSKNVVSIQSSCSIHDASDLMRRTGYSQLPVFSGDTPVGSISERGIFESISRGRSIEDVYRMSISEVMGESFPVIADTTPVATVAGMMNSCNAILVSEKGSIVGMITNADMLKLI